jgi:hypothetical protein
MTTIDTSEYPGKKFKMRVEELGGVFKLFRKTQLDANGKKAELEFQVDSRRSLPAEYPISRKVRYVVQFYTTSRPGKMVASVCEREGGDAVWKKALHGIDHSRVLEFLFILT